MILRKYNIFKQEKIESVKAIFIIYIISFLIGTSTHIIDIINFGFLGYETNEIINIYWTSLVFLDPIAILLLITLPFLGLIISTFIMITDVGINLSISIYYLIKYDNKISYKIYLQVVFLIFLLFTIGYCWEKIKENIEK
ncbi:MAG: hypothetical protein ACOCRO_05560 [Halanaerobiales bacterium]